MVKSTSTSARLLYGIESTYGQSPAAMKVWRGVLDDTLLANREYAESDERTPDLMSPERSLTYTKGGGSVNFEESAGSNDDMKIAVMNSAAWTAAVADGFSASDVLDCATSSGSNTLTLSGGASANWNVSVSGLTIGSYIRITGSLSGNNGDWRVVSGVASKVLTVVGPRLFVNETIAANTFTATMMAGLSNGIVKNSLTIEREYSDLTNEFAVLNGAIVTAMEKSYAVKGKVTGSVTIEAQNEVSATAPIDATPTAAPANKFYSVNSHFKGIMIDDALSNERKIISGSWKVEHPDFSFDEAGQTGPTEFGKARFVVSGTLEVYYEGNDALFTKYEGNTRVPIVFFSDDGAGNSDVEEFPNVILTQGSRMKKAGDTGTVVSYTWVADKHTAFNAMARFFRTRA